MDTSSPPRHSRSCTLCRQRKVKCDRQQPCCHCTRANLECIYPPGPGRAPKRPRNSSAFHAQVVDKLQSLEKVIKQLTAEREAALKGNDTIKSRLVDMAIGTSSSDIASTVPQVNGKTRAGSELQKTDAPLEEQVGRLIVQDTRSHYISNILWSNLGNEVRLYCLAFTNCKSTNAWVSHLFRLRSYVTCYMNQFPKMKVVHKAKRLHPTLVPPYNQYPTF